MLIERNLRYDLWLIMGVVALLGIGIVMIYSASSIPAQHNLSGQSAYFLQRQIMFACLGIAAMLGAMHVNYEKLLLITVPLLLIAVVLLIAVLIPGIGTHVKGGQRWIRFLGMGIQPSEVARLTLVLFLAHSLARKEDRIKSFEYGFLPYVVVTGFVAGLIFLEPDMGGAVTVGIIMMVMLFAAGTPIYLLAISAGLAVPVLFYFMVSADYRWRRVMATINPWDYWHDAGWHLVQSFLAFGSGGLLGVGLGDGRQKLFYLPDAHTDFILAAIGEELGLIGVIAVLALFTLVVARGVFIALRADSHYGSLLAFGLTAMIAVPALINMMVVLGLLPTKGLVLPFVSYGGSALVIYLTAMGILLNVSAKMYRVK
jgi:cell division protein FtsW